MTKSADEPPSEWGHTETQKPMSEVFTRSELRKRAQKNEQVVNEMMRSLTGRLFIDSTLLVTEMLGKIVPAYPIWRGRKFSLDTTLCFVLGPFSMPFFQLYEDVIIPALESTGLRGVHAGEIFGTREIMEDIWESICASRLIIADVTGRNPNVFYELGIAHTVGKNCIILAQSDYDVPFDIRSRRYLHYHPEKTAELRVRLDRTIKNALLE